MGCRPHPPAKLTAGITSAQSGRHIANYFALDNGETLSLRAQAEWSIRYPQNEQRAQTGNL